jgi:Methyltransferase domain
VARVLGIDIDEGAVSIARREASRRSLDNVALTATNSGAAIDLARSFGGEIDVFLLYAVLEHMTIDERLAVLDCALECTRPDGVIVVVESPNRLVSPDYHTSFLPFFSQLPDELAWRYFNRSERREFTDGLRDAAASGDEHNLALVRWGRGVSFHEFELVFGDLQRHVVAAGYEPMLFAERLVYSEELALARYMERVRPDLAPCFSRYWIDCILSPTPIEPSSVSFVWPWTAETRGSLGAWWTPWDAIELGPATTLKVNFPFATERVTTVVVSDSPEVRLRVGPVELRAPISAEPRHQALAEFHLPSPARSVQLELDAGGNVLFVGYEAPANRSEMAA